jgi:hypothetical protein
MVPKQEIVDFLTQNGFAILPRVLPPAQITRLISLLDQTDAQTSVRIRGGVNAIRNLSDVVPELRRLALSPKIRDLVEPILVWCPT